MEPHQRRCERDAQGVDPTPSPDQSGQLKGLSSTDKGRSSGINTSCATAPGGGERNVAYGGLGFALPASLVRGFLSDDGGATEVPSVDGQLTLENASDSELLTDLLVGAVAVWSRTGQRELALRAACDVLAATVTHGRAGFLHRVPGARISHRLAAAMENLDAKTRERLPSCLSLLASRYCMTQTVTCGCATPSATVAQCKRPLMQSMIKAVRCTS